MVKHKKSFKIKKIILSDSEDETTDDNDSDKILDDEIFDDELDDISDDNILDDDKFKDYEYDDVRNIIFKNINDKFAYGKLGVFDVIIMKSNGYINATKLCKDAKKEFFHWKENKFSKELIKNLGSFLGITKKEIMIIITGGNNIKIRGTYVHPTLITHVAYWCKPLFAIYIGIWIEEWKKYCVKNELKYWEKLSKCKVWNKDCKEEKIKLKLCKNLKGKPEIETDNGYIDILTKTAIIEVKDYINWKYALGQILAYSIYYPKKNKIIYLFNVPKQNKLIKIKKTCKKYGVKIIVYNYVFFKI